jgi:hypothetical protein
MSVFSAFQPAAVVTNPAELFGHNQPGGLLDRMVNSLLLGENFLLLGERRSGKSSLLCCCAAQLRKSEDRLVPVIINYYKQWDLAGWADAYRFLLANMHAALNAGSLLTAEFCVSIGRIEVRFPQTQSWKEIYEHLKSLEDYHLNSLLDAYVMTVNNELKIGFVLLFDEYEYMFHKTFAERPEAFFPIRELSTLPQTAEAPKPLVYVAAGAHGAWEVYQATGSPVLNTITNELTVSPLEPADFARMWDWCVAHSSSQIGEHLHSLGLSAEAVYDLTGGWPFYGKTIGQRGSSGENSDEQFYRALDSHFRIIWNRLTAVERHQMQEAERGRILLKSASTDLIRRGLLVSDGDGNAAPRGRLWARYVREQSSTESYETTNAPAPKGSEVDVSDKEAYLRLVVNDMIDLIMEINETCKNLHQEYMFTPTNEDPLIFRKLSQPALEPEQLAAFSLALYQLIFERTWSTDANGRTHTLRSLPQDQRYNKPIIRHLAAVRHKYGHLTSHPLFNSNGQTTYAEVTAHYLGHQAAPRNTELITIQRGLLQDTLDYLREVATYMREQSGVSTETASDN